MHPIKEEIHLEELYPLICEVIEAGGEFRLFPKGTSMRPTLVAGRDSVLLVKCDRIKKGDMVLYRRRNGAFVLHRVVKMEKDDTFTMRGDNQYVDEKGICADQIIAVVQRYYKGERLKDTTSFSFRLYLLCRDVTYPVRRFWFRVKRRLSRIAKEKK